MNHSIASAARRALWVGAGIAALAVAGGAAAQSYSYPSYSERGYYDDRDPAYAAPPAQTYSYSYDRPAYAEPSYSYSYPSTTYSYPSTTYSYESTTSTPAYTGPSYSYPARPYDYASTTDGITVYGHRRVSPYDEHPELSRAVPYADLDLRTQAGVDELHRRVARTARELCYQLGEPPAREQNTTVLPSCQSAARSSADIQIGQVVDSARYYGR